MARKRKNSTALFEVISAGRVDRKPVAAALKTPRWWFKGQSGNAAETSSPVTIQSDPTDPTANVTAETLYRARQLMAPAAAPTAPLAPAKPAPVAARPGSSSGDAYAAADLQDVGLASAAPAGCAPAVSAQSPAAPSTPASAALVPTTAASSRAAVSPSPVPAGPTAGARAADSPRALGRSQFRFDEDSQEVTLKMRYTTAIVTAFSVLVVVGTAYVIGRHLAEGPAQATASERQQSTAQVRKGPSQPGVMDLSRGPGNGPLPRLDTNNRLRAETPARISPGNASPPAANPPTAAASTVYADARIGPDGTAQRINNMNYIMILNLPPSAAYRQRAYEVRDLMTANGIPCTVEKVSKERGAAKIPANDGWYAVVGVRGFPPGYGKLPEYTAYRNAIAAAAARFPSKAKFDRIAPSEFKWME